MAIEAGTDTSPTRTAVLGGYAALAVLRHTNDPTVPRSWRTGNPVRSKVGVLFGLFATTFRHYARREEPKPDSNATYTDILGTDPRVRSDPGRTSYGGRDSTGLPAPYPQPAPVRCDKSDVPGKGATINIGRFKEHPRDPRAPAAKGSPDGEGNLVEHEGVGRPGDLRRPLPIRRLLPIFRGVRWRCRKVLVRLRIRPPQRPRSVNELHERLPRRATRHR